MNSIADSFWRDMDAFFPDIIAAVTSLSKKSYFSITNLANVSQVLFKSF